MHEDIEEKFFRFLQARAQGDDIKSAIRSGHFSARPDQTEPDLFGSLDLLHASHILGTLDNFLDPTARDGWIDHILSYQGDDGWFRSGDTQHHGVEHATAYAMGGLMILTQGDGGRLRQRLKPLEGLKSTIVPDPDRAKPPFHLSLLQRVHFWRGSHRAGGLAAIVGMVDDLSLPSEKYVGIDDAKGWLDGWWEYFSARVEPRTGYWSLASGVLRRAFNTLYQFRHDPDLASMGGAVHLYWVSDKINAPMPYPNALISETASLMRPTGLYETEPYCIDLDANFLIGRALGQLDENDPLHSPAREALSKNRDSILEWFGSREPEEWNANSHKLPGAFAAVAEADLVLRPANGRWRDVFQTTWWL